MPLAPNTRLGPYEVLAALGAGGMGEVYRARDTRLGREVAIKVLPQHLSTNAEVRARFEREAKTISSLNHPHICVLYDVGREGDTDYLVMELIEGQTLAERLARGALPLADSLRIGAQVADALDKAHRAGVVHRDLKPGNVMLTRSGAKLMDFGLARVTGLAGPISGSGVTMAALTQSPTMAAPLTAEGTIVGTFQYMAPEQLEGREADARTDLWALGLVIYEMVTGRRPFEGKSQASLIAAILEREPAPIGTLVPLVPPALERLVGACLAKDPEERIQTAHDVKLQLQWIVEGGSQLGVPAPVASRRRSRERLSWVIAAVAVGALVVFVTVLGLRQRTDAPETRFLVSAPANQNSVSWPRLSPDGKMLAFLAEDTTRTTRIWVRPMKSFVAYPLAGTEGAGRPFWSADSRFLGYMTEGHLKKAPVEGGPSLLIGDLLGRVDGTWGSQNVILLDATAGDSLLSVSAAGGTPRPATSLDRVTGESSHTWPQFLPDGRHFLFEALHNGGDRLSHIKLGRLGSLKSWDLTAAESRAEFAPPHYVLYLREGTLVAQSLDLGRHRLTGDPIPVTDGVFASRNNGEFSSSPSGALAFTSATGGISSELVWMDRAGRRLAQAAPPNLYHDIALSPDGKRVAMGIADSRTGHEDIWVRDLDRGVASRLTFNPGEDLWPAWSGDGKRVFYGSDHLNGLIRVFSKPATGLGEEDSLVAWTAHEAPSDCSRDGKWIVTSVLESVSGWDILVRSTAAGARPQPFLTTPAIERDGAFSPDGRWIAYRSHESGRPEVYVRSFPGGDSRFQISTSGGSHPAWRADGREMYYLGSDGMIMAVPIESGAALQPGVPFPLFRVVLAQGGFVQRRWCVSPDGQRFLINTPVGRAQETQFAVSLNWMKELAKK